MKRLNNNEINVISFQHNGEDFTNAVNLRLRQLGSSKDSYLPIDSMEIDCFVATFTVTIPKDFSPNGNYRIDILDNNASELLSANALLFNYDENNPLQYVVLSGEQDALSYDMSFDL